MPVTTTSVDDGHLNVVNSVWFTEFVLHPGSPVQVPVIDLDWSQARTLFIRLVFDVSN